MTTLRLLSVVLALCVAASLSRVSKAQEPFRVVVLTGQPAPDIAGAVFQPRISSIGIPVRGISLNGSGQLSFKTDLADGREALYTEAGPGGLQLLAVTGNQPPLSPSGSEFLYFHQEPLIFNDNGVTAFFGGFSAPGDREDRTGVWTYDTVSGIQLVGRGGEPLAGQEDRTFPAQNVNIPFLNRAGTVSSELLDFINRSRSIVHQASGGSLQTIAMPGTPEEFVRVGTEGLSDAGHLVFLAQHPGSFSWPGDDPEDNAGVWMSNGGALSQIAATRDTSFGFDFGRFWNASVNNSGEAVFTADLFPSNVRGVFKQVQGEDLRAVAIGGQMAPGVGPGIEWGSIDEALVDSEGRTLFVAGLSDARRALYRENSPDEFDLLVLTGEPAPGQENANWTDIRDFAANRSGQVALLAEFRRQANPTESLAGFWIVQPDGSVVPVVAEGDQIEVAPGDLRTVFKLGLLRNSNNEDGRQNRFNDQGQLAFDLEFDDGTVAYLVSSPLPVPEPGGLALALAALIATVIAYRKRRR